MTIFYRYRVVFYHENQRWVHKVMPLIDRAPLLLFSTDSPEAFQNKLESQEVDVILTGVNTKYFVLQEDGSNSMSFKHAPIWEVIASYHLKCQVILFCSQSETPLAANLVQEGLISDYCIINPLLDKSRPYLSVIRAMQDRMYRDVLQQKVLGGDHAPKDLLEMMEMLQTIRSTPAAEDAMSAEPQDFPAEPRILPEPPAFRSVFEPSPTIPDALGEDDEEEDLFAPGSAKRARGFSDGGSTIEDKIGKLPFDVSSEADVSLPAESMSNSEFDILLVDNHPAVIDSIAQIITQLGYKVLVATSAEEGLFYLNQERFKMMLINSHLPDQNGLSFVSAIRTLGPQADIPIIIISEQAIGANILHNQKLGANYFLAQPIDPIRLGIQIKQLMQRS